MWWIGEHEPVPVLGGADQRDPEGRLVGEVADRGAFGGAQLLRSAPRHRASSRRSSTYRHGVSGSAGMICTGSSNWSQKRAARLGWRLTTVCTASRSRSASSGPVDGDVQLHRVHVVAGILRGAGVEQQALLQRGQRQHVGDPVLLLQLVDLLLAQPGRRDVRRRQPAAAGSDVRADAGQRLEPQLAQPADLVVVERRGRPRPVGLQLRAGRRCRRCRR